MGKNKKQKTAKENQLRPIMLSIEQAGFTIEDPLPFLRYHDLLNIRHQFLSEKQKVRKNFIFAKRQDSRVTVEIGVGYIGDTRAGGSYALHASLVDEEFIWGEISFENNLKAFLPFIKSFINQSYKEIRYWLGAYPTIKRIRKLAPATYSQIPGQLNSIGVPRSILIGKEKNNDTTTDHINNQVFNRAALYKNKDDAKRLAEASDDYLVLDHHITQKLTGTDDKYGAALPEETLKNKRVSKKWIQTARYLAQYLTTTAPKHKLSDHNYTQAARLSIVGQAPDIFEDSIRKLDLAKLPPRFTKQAVSTIKSLGRAGCAYKMMQSNLSLNTSRKQKLYAIIKNAKKYNTADEVAVLL